MFKALVSRGSKALQRLDERLNDEGEEDAFEEGWGEEERKALEPVSIDDVDVDDRDALRRRISKLQGMVVSMEEALEAERSPRDTAQKLGRALQDAATVDGLVDEYGKLASEACGYPSATRGPSRSRGAARRAERVWRSSSGN